MIGDKKVLSIITARAGSKGIPKKNVRVLLGKPLFMWSVLASLNSEYVDKTLVSSDCDDCAFITGDFLLTEFVKSSRGQDFQKNYDKCFFIERPKELATDISKNEEALIHALKCVNNEFDIIINLQPTSPCRLSNLLDRCIEEYFVGGYDSLLTGTKETPFIWRKKDNKWIYDVDKNNCCERKMRQQFKEDNNSSEFIFHDNGNIYITDKNILLDKKCRIGYNPVVFETSGINNLQIDTIFDFDLIENFAKSQNLKELI